MDKFKKNIMDKSNNNDSKDLITRTSIIFNKANNNEVSTKARDTFYNNDIH